MGNSHSVAREEQEEEEYFNLVQAVEIAQQRSMQQNDVESGLYRPSSRIQILLPPHNSANSTSQPEPTRAEPPTIIHVPLPAQGTMPRYPPPVSAPPPMCTVPILNLAHTSIRRSRSHMSIDGGACGDASSIYPSPYVHGKYDSESDTEYSAYTPSDAMHEICVVPPPPPSAPTVMPQPPPPPVGAPFPPTLVEYDHFRHIADGSRSRSASPFIPDDISNSPTRSFARSRGMCRRGRRGSEVVTRSRRRPRSPSSDCGEMDRRGRSLSRSPRHSPPIPSLDSHRGRRGPRSSCRSVSSTSEPDWHGRRRRRRVRRRRRSNSRPQRPSFTQNAVEGSAPHSHSRESSYKDNIASPTRGHPQHISDHGRHMSTSRSRSPMHVPRDSRRSRSDSRLAYTRPPSICTNDARYGRSRSPSASPRRREAHFPQRSPVSQPVSLVQSPDGVRDSASEHNSHHEEVVPLTPILQPPSCCSDVPPLGIRRVSPIQARVRSTTRSRSPRFRFRRQISVRPTMDDRLFSFLQTGGRPIALSEPQTRSWSSDSGSARRRSRSRASYSSVADRYDRLLAAHERSLEEHGKRTQVWHEQVMQLAKVVEGLEKHLVSLRSNELSSIHSLPLNQPRGEEPKSSPGELSSGDTNEKTLVGMANPSEQAKPYPHLPYAAGFHAVRRCSDDWRPAWRVFPLKAFRGSSFTYLKIQSDWDDADLLREMSRSYDKLRTIWRKWFSLRSVRSITMVYADHTFVYPKRVGPAGVSPTKNMRLRYFLHHPDKMRGRYEFMQVLTARTDLGIEFVEGWQLTRISIAILLPVIASLLLGIFYSLFVGEVSDAFTIAGYMTSAYSVCLVLLGLLNFVEF